MYDAGGGRLTRADPDGTVTAYLGGEEIKQSPGGTLTAARYYGSLASRTPTGLTWLDSDHHGTATTAVGAVSLASTTRRTMPFGEPRGTAPAWPNPKDFVGGTQDPTGLTHLGAHEYDPTIGRFISVDPLLDLTDPQSWNGYAYAGHRPTSSADASGLGITMDPAFIGEFAQFKGRYVEGGPDRFEYVIPVELVPRFNELTVLRDWKGY